MSQDIRVIIIRNNRNLKTRKSTVILCVIFVRSISYGVRVCDTIDGSRVLTEQTSLDTPLLYIFFSCFTSSQSHIGLFVYRNSPNTADTFFRSFDVG